MSLPCLFFTLFYFSLLSVTSYYLISFLYNQSYVLDFVVSSSPHFYTKVETYLILGLAAISIQQVMGTESNMNNLNTSSSPDTTIFAVPKLCDDGSNWSDYKPQIQCAMGAKGLLQHILGNAIVPVLYAVSNGIPMLADGKTPATKDQIEFKESKIIEYEKREYLACHILLSMTSTHLGSKIKDLKTIEAMWKVITEDATSNSVLYILDAEDQLASMKLLDNKDPKTHLSELRAHFQTMLQQ